MYENVFGRNDLDRLICGQIRDDQLMPGDLHTRLTQLPWRDVFTTNWDTLLERTCMVLPEPTYDVVYTPSHIPIVSQPRIFKLHGTLSSQFPLIVTENDYRTYPEKFAPFVITVKLAMMETVFILVGFSGDNPNFKEWSG